MEKDLSVDAGKKQEKGPSWAQGDFIILLATKGGMLFKLLKALKFAKYAITAITMAISAMLYGFYHGSWMFGLGLVLLLLIHEMGHVGAMVRRGMPTKAPVFIPFLGAAIFVPGFKGKDEEAYVGYGGPLIGTIGALGCIAIAFAFTADSRLARLFHLLGYVGLFVNLFNLIPARPLDGGRILGGVGRWVGYIGVPILLVLAYVAQDLFFVMIALLSMEESAYRVRVWVRCVLGAITSAVFSLMYILELTMKYRISSGFWHSCPAGASLILIGIGGFGLVLLLYAWRYRHEQLPKLAREIESEEVLPLKLRIKWTALYVILLAGLFSIMVWQSKYLPQEVREHSLVRFVS